MPNTPQQVLQPSFMDNLGSTAPAVPGIRQAVREWRAKKYAGATETSKKLLNHWFIEHHKLPTGQRFAYYACQREAIETLIYVYEVAKTRSQVDLYQRFIPAELASQVRLPPSDPFARYCLKMATGSGKTKVMSLAIAWQYLNNVIEADDRYARTFLIVAPNVIVYERLRSDFAGGLVFRTDPVIPKSMEIYWDMATYMRGEAERATSAGAVYLTNIQQLYERENDDDDEPDIMTMVLGHKPPATLHQEVGFRERIVARDKAPVMVLNDEAHHTHDPQSVWMQTLRTLAEEHPKGTAVQLDLSATPRHTSGALFAWTIYDYTLRQAIVDRIVKRPVKGITEISEVASDVPDVRYRPFLVAAVKRWQEYRDQLAPTAQKPLLFVMMNSTKEADAIAAYLRKQYPDDFAGAKTLVIHTNRQGDVAVRDLDTARQAAREVDSDDSPINALVSVLMLREGWDVKNVTVIVGLRPYTAKANILPEQTIGRGLRLMFRDLDTTYTERVDIIGNPGFMRFIEQLEQEEEMELDTWNVGKDRLTIITIEPVEEKKAYDIRLPILSPILTRTSSLEGVIAGVDVAALAPTPPMPYNSHPNAAETFTYRGMDMITLEELFAREYEITAPQTSQEVIAYYAQCIARELRLPSQFAALAPKVRDFLRYHAFGGEIDLSTPESLQAIGRTATLNATIDIFRRALRERLVRPATPVLENKGMPVSALAPFPWSRQAPICRRTVLNKVPCDNAFEEHFARFLDDAPDVARFSKLPLCFGFSIPYQDVAGNLRHYYPDWVVVDEDGTHYLVETKGQDTADVHQKDRSALAWAGSASELTGVPWSYVKVLQEVFEDLAPHDFAGCALMGQMTLDGLG